MEWISESPDDTLALGRRLGERAAPGDVIALTGDLGTGKTVLAKGLAVGAGVRHERLVTSPTFVLVHEYAGRLPVFHVDAYRLHGARDLVALGADEWFFGEGLCIVEWADRVREALPAERLDVHLEHLGPTRRRLILTPRGARYLERIAPLQDKGA